MTAPDAGKHDPQSDTVKCAKCRRTVRKAMCRPSHEHAGALVCSGQLKRSCGVQWLETIDRKASGRDTR